MQHNISKPEEWRAIPGYEGMYEVSDRGRVRGLDRVNHLGNKIKGRALKPSTTRDGYKKVTLSNNGELEYKRVNRLVLEAFVGPCPEGMVSCHGNANPGDNRLNNLRWDSIRENVMDQIRMGTQRNVRKTHCPRGHELSGANLKPAPLKHGARVCLACSRTHRYVNDHDLGHAFQKISDSYYADIMKGSA